MLPLLVSGSAAMTYVSASGANVSGAETAAASSWRSHDDGAAALACSVCPTPPTITHSPTSSRQRRLHENRDRREFCMDDSFNGRLRSSRVHPARRHQSVCGNDDEHEAESRAVLRPGRE